MKKIICLFALVAMLLAGCSRPALTPGPGKQLRAGRQALKNGKIPPTQRPYKIKNRTYYPIPDAHGFSQNGIASWYGPYFHGRKTSNGETYDMYAQTAAHKTLPMNTYVLVKNLENNKESVVRINDRGPFVRGRIIDLSKKAAGELGIVKNGTARVRIQAMGETISIVRQKQRYEKFLPFEDFHKGNFHVQIGSFQNRENAIRLRNRLNKQSFQAIVRNYQHDDNIFFRVQVQAGNILAKAEKVEDELISMGFSDSFIIAQ